MKKIRNLFISLIAIVCLMLPILASATSTSALTNRLQIIGGQAGYNTTLSTPIIIGYVIQAFLGFLGITFIVLLIMAGYKWMSANGNEEDVKKATQTIKESIIGLFITLSAWTIWDFIFNRLIKG